MPRRQPVSIRLPLPLQRESSRQKILWGRRGASLFFSVVQEKFFLFPEKGISLNDKEKQLIIFALNRDLPHGPPCHRHGAVLYPESWKH